ncbi:hypothetical protein GCM10009696_23390 [Kocuria himachalensis]
MKPSPSQVPSNQANGTSSGSRSEGISIGTGLVLSLEQTEDHLEGDPGDEQAGDAEQGEVEDFECKHGPKLPRCSPAGQ